MKLTRSEVRQYRKHKRKKQMKINVQLKKRLFGHLTIAPCCYCRRVFFCTELTVEHLIPLCLGGTNDPSNIALACSPCNHNRGKEAWVQKRLLNKKRHEEYSAQHRKQDWSNSIQDPQSPDLHSQREGV
jgi:5-methylcytosine-specific restriction endonuclease McrA